MLKCAVCDDDEITINRLEELLSKINFYKLDYDSFTSGEKLLQYIQKTGTNYDVFFIDIEMPGRNGLEIASEIRKNDMYATIIFITSHTEFMEKAFEVLTFRFLIKPVSEARFIQVVKDIIHHFEVTKKKFLFQYDKEYYSIGCNDIMFIEKIKRLLYIHTKDNYIYKCNLTVNEALKQLNKKLFVKIYPSIIVNLDYVNTLGKEFIIMDDYTKLPLSRRNKESFKKNFIEFAKDRMCL